MDVRVQSYEEDVLPQQNMSRSASRMARMAEAMKSEMGPSDSEGLYGGATTAQSINRRRVGRVVKAVRISCCVCRAMDVRSYQLGVKVGLSRRRESPPQ